MSVVVLSKLSLGTLKFAVNLGVVSLSNNKDSKSSKFLKNSSVIASFGLIRKLSLLVVAPLNGLSLTLNLIKLSELGSVYPKISYVFPL